MKELGRYREALLTAWARQPDIVRAAWQAARNAPEADETLLRLWWWEGQVGYPNLMALLHGLPPRKVLPPRPKDVAPAEDMLSDYHRWRMAAVDALRRAPLATWSTLGRHPRVGRRTVQWWVERSLAEGRRALHRFERLRRNFNEREDLARI